jgi:hypothetical protein
MTRQIVAEMHRRHRASAPEEKAEPARYSATGHPSIQELMAEQGTAPIQDTSVLHGDFWPEEESVEDFLETLYAWRGLEVSDPAA